MKIQLKEVERVVLKETLALLDRGYCIEVMAANRKDLIEPDGYIDSVSPYAEPMPDLFCMVGAYRRARKNLGVKDKIDFTKFFRVNDIDDVMVGFDEDPDGMINKLRGIVEAGSYDSRHPTAEEKAEAEKLLEAYRQRVKESLKANGSMKAPWKD